MPGTHCYAQTGETATPLMIIFEPKQLRFTSATHVLRYVITKTRAQIKNPDTLDVWLVSSSFAFSFCKLRLSSVRIYFKAHA